MDRCNKLKALQHERRAFAYADLPPGSASCETAEGIETYSQQTSTSLSIFFPNSFCAFDRSYVCCRLSQN